MSESLDCAHMILLSKLKFAHLCVLYTESSKFFIACVNSLLVSFLRKMRICNTAYFIFHVPLGLSVTYKVNLLHPSHSTSPVPMS